jgi:hypothetical protein
MLQFGLLALVLAQEPKPLDQIAALNNTAVSEQMDSTMQASSENTPASTLPEASGNKFNLPLPLPILIAIASTLAVLAIVLLIFKMRRRNLQQRKLRSLAKKGKFKSNKPNSNEIEQYDALSEYEKRMIMNTNQIDTRRKFVKGIDGSMVQVSAGYDGGVVPPSVENSTKPKKMKFKSKSPPLTIMPLVQEEEV